MRRTRNLTLKQRRFIQAYVRIGNATQAARETLECSTDESAATRGSQMLRKLQIPVSDLMDRSGISDARLVNVLADGLEAERVLANGQRYPDYSTRRAYLEIAFKIKGHYRNKIAVESSDGRPQGPIFLPVISDRLVTEANDPE